MYCTNTKISKIGAYLFNFLCITGPRHYETLIILNGLNCSQTRERIHTLLWGMLRSIDSVLTADFFAALTNTGASGPAAVNYNIFSQSRGDKLHDLKVQHKV